MKTRLARLAFFFFVALAVGPVTARAATAAGTAPRLIVDWDAGWLFRKSDPATAMAPGFADADWQHVRVPHDWSTEEPFRPDYGSGNGYAAGGIGWYRKHFPTDAAWQGRGVAIEFDGVYENAEVWINGQFVGGRPYGYSSFTVEITPYLNAGAAENVLAVRVDHSRYADSRWYSGSGIYRHVRLVATDPLRVAQWGTFVSTPTVTNDAATVHVETSVQNTSERARNFSVQIELLDDTGAVVATATRPAAIEPHASAKLAQDIPLAHPRLWSLDTPALYTARTRLVEGDAVRDETLTRFGVRTITFDADRGFALNGVAMKLKGVCVHHDAGPLGAAVPVQVWERRLRALKEIGVNAIRTSHNPPAPELLDLCDRLGLLVKDEAFDEFTPTKNKWVSGWNDGQPSRYGYGEFFAEWGVRDAQDMVRRDRNHPSIVLWSIGNEIDYPNDPFSHPVLGEKYRPANPRAENLVTCAEPLVAAVKAFDSTRPVTAALASIVMSNAVGLPEKLDAVGYNYQEANYAADHAKYPQRVIYGSENSHSLEAWTAVRDNAYVAGQFLWTGIDYLGEARKWPNRASGSGLLDLCGFKKPMAWFRQSLWSDRPMVYLCVPAPSSEARRRVAVESWNWTAGARVSVECYTNCAEVELMLNGRSLGVKPASAAVGGILTWSVPYAAGELKAIGRTGGREAASFALETADAPSRIELVPDVRALRADANDLCQLEFRVVDAHGRIVPDAAQTVTLAIDGPAELLAMGNADLSSPENCRDATHAVFHGRGLAFVRSTDRAGQIAIKATAPGLAPATLVLNSAK
ncbi:MAG TPA: glycoside hydrolase family 2 TIM barrel-domain containing protein [Opitutaceae bacterium]|nr:glycoside hydrolase family 2 TIM barrel-domain containing protein [Opitutaceae bacterium]